MTRMKWLALQGGCLWPEGWRYWEWRESDYLDAYVDWCREACAAAQGDLS